MQISEAKKFWMEYHKSNSKENSIRAYKLVLSKFCEEFGSENIEDVTTEKVLSFLNRITEGRKQQTKQTRYSELLAFFNFIKNNLDPELRNPCDTPMLKKLFRAKPSYHWNIIEKETVDEIIFRTSKPRNRLMLELMARGGMRISEVLKLTPSDINDRRLTLRDPKSGREQEFIFIPQRLADRLKDYIREIGIQPHQRIFPICYEAAREMVAKAGGVVGIHLGSSQHATGHRRRCGSGKSPGHGDGLLRVRIDQRQVDPTVRTARRRCAHRRDLLVTAGILGRLHLDWQKPASLMHLEHFENVEGRSP